MGRAGQYINMVSYHDMGQDAVTDFGYRCINNYQVSIIIIDVDRYETSLS